MAEVFGSWTFFFGSFCFFVFCIVRGGAGAYGGRKLERVGVLRGWSLHTYSGSAAFGFTERSRKISGRKSFKPKIIKKKLRNESGWMCERERDVGR